MRWSIKDGPRITGWLLTGWLVLNVLQSYFTELAHDEAYYWMYSRFMDWGYYDHPPMIALWIKAGYAFFSNELGVRLLVALASAGTLLLVHRMTARKNFVLLFALACSIGVFHVYSFIAVPDAPLILFTALFFLLYRNYLERDTWLNTALLSLAVALLIYSKYHAFLILFFTILSNWKILTRRSFYAIVVLSILLITPHVIWQIMNDYPSYKYHVLYKSQEPYDFMDTVNYVLGQLLIFGPLITVPLFYAAFKFKSKDPLHRALKWNVIGVLVFFLLSSFNDRVEPNWTAVLLVPLLVLAHNYITGNSKLQLWVNRIAVVSLVIFMVGRVHLMYSLLPESMNVKAEFHGWKQWAQEISAKAEGRPVVFTNSYKRASKYAFYSSETSFSANNVSYRRNQYDLWDIEDSIRGKDVLWIANWYIGRLDTFRTNKDTRNYQFIENYQSYRKVFIEIEQEVLTFGPGEEVRLPVTLKNNYGYPIRFDDKPESPVMLAIDFFQDEKHLEQTILKDISEVQLIDSYETEVQFHAPEKEGRYYVRLSVLVTGLPPSINSHLIPADVEQGGKE